MDRRLVAVIVLLSAVVAVVWAYQHGIEIAF